MEEQRARQEDEAKKAVAASVSETSGAVQKMEGKTSLYSPIMTMHRWFRFVSSGLKGHSTQN